MSVVKEKVEGLLKGSKERKEMRRIGKEKESEDVVQFKERRIKKSGIKAKENFPKRAVL